MTATTTTTLPSKFSPQQTAVHDWARTGKGSAFVEAVAGAGKTTGVLIPLLAFAKGSIFFAAFNKKIVVEIEQKVAAAIREGRLPSDLKQRLRVGTFHSFGFSAWRYVHKNVKTDARMKDDMTRDWLKTTHGPTGEALASFVLNLVSLAKQRAIGVKGSIDDAKLWWDIVEHFDLAYEVEDEALLETGVKLAIEALRKHIEWSPEVINFDDMLYMPVYSGCRMWENDWGLVDEAQDTNPIRRMLARKILRPNGRSCWVGDRHQAIYGFSGADSDAIDQIIRDFRCATLPLTVTYRCPKNVVAAAQSVVSHIVAHETAPDGSVTTLDMTDMFKAKLTADDAILCRNTKPLVQTAYALLRKGVPCHVEGKDIGVGLLKLANKYKVNSLDNLKAKLEKFCEVETQKLIAKGKETQAEALADRIETLFVMMEGCQTVAQLRQKISDMFVDSENEARPTLTLSTVHKAKGREWGTVYVLGYDTLMPSRFARQDWQLEQENNLIYVAYTRAKANLALVRMPLQPKD